MSRPATAADLRKVDLFDDVDDAELAEWIRVTSVRDVEPGTVIAEQDKPVPGVELAGTFPADIQDYTLYTTAIPKASTDPEGARAFVAHLTSPAMAVRWKAAGFEPPK